MITVQTAEARDVPAITRVHTAAFGGFFLTELGTPFLKQYYLLVRRHPDGILLAARDGDEIVGFVAGTVNPPAFYRALVTNAWRFAWPAGIGLLRKPKLLPTLASNLRSVFTRRQSPVSQPAAAELTSVAIHPSARGRGLGQQLVAAFLQAVRNRAARVSLTTDAEDNVAVNHFYRQMGFELAETFASRRGRLMNRYVIDATTAKPSP